MKATRRQFVQGLGLAAPVILTSNAMGSVAQAADSAKSPKAKEPLKLNATLVLTRHAEKATGGDRRDPELSEEGQARAEHLATMFGAAGVTSLLHTEYKRTRNTLAPLAEAVGIPSETVEARQMGALLKRISDAKAGEVIVVAGHSNTTPAIAYAFGITLPDLEPIAAKSRAKHGNLSEDTFDRVHVLTPGRDGANLLELRH